MDEVMNRQRDIFGSFRRLYPTVTRDFLMAEYVEKERPATLIAADVGCDSIVIRYWLKKYGIAIRSPGFYRARAGADLLGLRFGKLLALNRIEKSNNQRWMCICDCGQKYIALASNLKNGSVTECRECFCPRAGFGEIPQAAWSDIVRGARKRDIPFTVSIEECNAKYIAQNRRCALSGMEILFAKTRRGHVRLRESTASLDRIDSSSGYAPGNVQWVHKVINVMKGSLSDAEFVRICATVGAYNDHI